MSRKFITPIGDEGIYALDTASWRTVRPVMDKEVCIECGFCMSFCPVMSIYREDTADGKGKHIISYDYCKGCGLCAKECPKNCISMEDEGGFGNG